jgi:hypothetical protein
MKGPHEEKFSSKPKIMVENRFGQKVGQDDIEGLPPAYEDKYLVVSYAKRFRVVKVATRTYVILT